MALLASAKTKLVKVWDGGGKSEQEVDEKKKTTKKNKKQKKKRNTNKAKHKQTPCES